MRKWQRISFSEIFQAIRRPITINDNEIYKSVGVRWYGKGAFVRETQQGIDIARKQQWIIKSEDIVYNKLFAWKGAFAVADKEVDGCIVSDKFPTYRANLEIVDLRFVGYYFRTPELAQQAQNLSKGAAAISKLTLNPPQFWDLTIPLPPLNEQRRIAARIDELTAKIEEVRRLRRQTVEEAEMLLQSAMHRQFKSLQERGTQRQPIVTFATVLRGRGPMYEEGSGKLAVNQKCVRWNGVDITCAREVSDAWIQSLPSQYLLQENDLVVNSTGEGTIGRACVVTPNAIGFPFDSHVLVVRAEKDKALPMFIAYFLRSPIGQRAIEDSKGAKTTKQTELGTTKLGDISIPVAPLPEQRRIVAYLDRIRRNVDALKQLQAETSAELEGLLRSVLEKAFKGEL